LNNEKIDIIKLAQRTGDIHYTRSQSGKAKKRLLSMKKNARSSQCWMTIKFLWRSQGRPESASVSKLTNYNVQTVREDEYKALMENRKRI